MPLLARRAAALLPDMTTDHGDGGPRPVTRIDSRPRCLSIFRVIMADARVEWLV
jgi:hypothetical protein